jgi:hypothetical protein
MKYAMDDDLGYDPDAVEAAMHAREEAAWEEEPEPVEDRVADSMRWTPPAAEPDRDADREAGQ